MRSAANALIACALCASACGAKTGLLAPEQPPANAPPASEPPGCQWRVGARTQLATDAEEAVAPRVGHVSSGAIGPDSVLWLWRAFGPDMAGQRSVVLRAAEVGFDGVQRGATRVVADTTAPSNGLSIIGPPEIVRTDTGYAALLWQGIAGCRTIRLAGDAAVLATSPLFAAGQFCEDMTSLSDGALRVYAGARPIGTLRLSFLHVTGFVEVDAGDRPGAPRRTGDTVLARVTFADRTGIELTPGGSADDALVAVRTGSDGRRTGSPVALQAWPADRPMTLSMRPGAGGAVAQWAMDDPSGPVAAELAVFTEGGALSQRLSLPLGTQPGVAIRGFALDATASRVSVSWSERGTGPQAMDRLVVRVFDRAGTALSPPLEVLATSSAQQAYIRATSRGALVFGAGSIAPGVNAFAAPIECAL